MLIDMRHVLTAIVRLSVQGDVARPDDGDYRWTQRNLHAIHWPL